MYKVVSLSWYKAYFPIFWQKTSIDLLRNRKNLLMRYKNIYNDINAFWSSTKETG